MITLPKGNVLVNIYIDGRFYDKGTRHSIQSLTKVSKGLHKITWDDNLYASNPDAFTASERRIPE